MSTNEVIDKISKLPEDLLKSASDYIDFLLLKAGNDRNNEKLHQRKFGALKGKLWIADDFNAPLDELKDYM
jgi:hypothetical protein